MYGVTILSAFSLATDFTPFFLITDT
jgi:hypothetical protein